MSSLESAGVPEVSVGELARSADGRVPVIDVREPDEYESGHVPGAKLVPMGEVVERVAEIPKGVPVYVICQSGGRSLKAARWYRARGIDARNVTGGTKAWIDAGNDTVAGPDPQ